ncbi:hypothetical protein IV487_01745 [Enterococcus saccharolyticus]|uniref:hypothetical protein n=1 Tax=Enterococcus saccharolyticus TaxID=41997 RepID=UPI001E2F1A6E|nr:hypothetical protein [Enterococcus saccharolyticus]MCD5001186.1 hypothetical protein [Enterococcus saccharolyticus]
MSKQFKVLVAFRDLQDNDRVYQPGELYEGAQSTERLEELSGTKNKIGKKLIEEIEEVTEAEPDFPKHVGGGQYELSNGEKVKGKDAALAAEKALHDEKEGD